MQTIHQELLKQLWSDSIPQIIWALHIVLLEIYKNYFTKGNW